MLLVNVDDDFLDRLQDLAALVLAEEHLRTRHAELETLAAHRLDQDRKLQFAAARDDVGVGIGRRLDLQRDIAFRFLEKAVANDAARHFVAFGAGERAVVDRECHRQSRRINRLRVQRLDFLRIHAGYRQR